MADKTLDVKGLNCPIPIMKVKKAINEVPKGGTLEVLATDCGDLTIDGGAERGSVDDGASVGGGAHEDSAAAGADLDIPTRSAGAGCGDFAVDVKLGAGGARAVVRHVHGDAQADLTGVEVRAELLDAGPLHKGNEAAGGEDVRHVGEFAGFGEDVSNRMAGVDGVVLGKSVAWVQHGGLLRWCGVVG